jgi:hypothetical protein
MVPMGGIESPTLRFSIPVRLANFGLPLRSSRHLPVLRHWGATGSVVIGNVCGFAPGPATRLVQKAEDYLPDKVPRYNLLPNKRCVAKSCHLVTEF